MLTSNRPVDQMSGMGRTKVILSKKHYRYATFFCVQSKNKNTLMQIFAETKLMLVPPFVKCAGRPS